MFGERGKVVTSFVYWEENVLFIVIISGLLEVNTSRRRTLTNFSFPEHHLSEFSFTFTSTEQQKYGRSGGGGGES